MSQRLIKEGLFFAESPDIAKGVSCFFTLRARGDFSQPKNVATLLKEQGRKEGVRQIVLAEQVHGANFGWVRDFPPLDFVPRVDALLSQKPGIALGIRTADCLPLFLIEKKAQVIAALHLGWRGLKANLLRRVIRALVKSGFPAADFVAIGGPAICRQCYSVGKEVAGLFPAETVRQRGKKIFLDLTAVAGYQLKKAGINQAIFADYCTYHQADLFFSHRRGEVQRMLNWLALSTT